MRIGIDFDNTIVCYDDVFFNAAQKICPIPQSIGPSKKALRDWMRSQGKEREWIELQGEVYGSKISEAQAFPGALDFLSDCTAKGIEFAIISHKTKRPVAGQNYDLHAAARDWLAQNGIHPGDKQSVFFELTRDAKLSRIEAFGCTHFIDDLIEFLDEPAFPYGVVPMLFAPSEESVGRRGFSRFRSWAEISKFFEKAEAKSSGSPTNLANRLLSQFSTDECSDIEQKLGGANNRVYDVRTSESRYVLKCSFRASEDERDRFGNELAFYQYCEAAGIECVPRMYAYDKQHNAILLEFMDAHNFNGVRIGASHVEQAADFIVALNGNRKDRSALPHASETAWSVDEHIGIVDRRIRRLTELAPNQPIGEFVASALAPTWQRVKSTAGLAAADMRYETLPDADRCVSPSDFGFHNALVSDNDMVRFFDFEYGGIDDPARMVCDFFSQVAFPVSASFAPTFIERICHIVRDDVWLRERTRILMPIYKIKWCCIVLNAFLPEESERRRFAGVPLDEAFLQKKLELAASICQEASRMTDTRAVFS